MAHEVPDDGTMLPLMEEFYTIQGEGYHTGKAAYFIRLGGCDVGCHWCDVKESWDKDKHSLKKTEELVEEAKKSGTSIVVITGGEPAMYPLDKLTRLLKEEGLHVHLETSGAYMITGTFDWICLSPKKTKPPLGESLKKANELKVVIYNKNDFNWAEKNASGVTEDCRLFLQPEWSKANSISSHIIEHIKQNPRWELSLQIHKYLNIR